MQHTITFTHNDNQGSVETPTGTLLSDAAHLAGIDIGQPCGGQGRCGRCAVQVTGGTVRRRSTLRLSPADIEQGYALACQAVIEGDVSIYVPPQEKIERRLTTDRVVAEVSVPSDYEYPFAQTVRRVHLTLNPPSMDDQTDDWSRLQTAFRLQHQVERVTCSVSLLRKIGDVLRKGDWRVTAIIETIRLSDHETIRLSDHATIRLIDLLPGHEDEYSPLWGCAIDIGTTTVSLWLVDLVTGQVRAQVAEYNGQIARGEDVISRIMYASRNGGRDELRQRVLDTINSLLDVAFKRVKLPQGKVTPEQVVKTTIAGNSTMMHLLLGIPASNIRLSPFITTVNQPPLTTGREVGLNVNPEAVVDCLPGVASYVGADITAGVLSSGLDSAENVTLFLDVGTNGETVLGDRDWLVTCACSAGPAFEGAGVVNGMRATTGAIEEVWINSETLEPTYRVIGGGKPKGICGSGLISLLSESFITGILDKGGNVNLMATNSRVRDGAHGGEYVVAWGAESESGADIVLSRVDVDNLLRAKAAIYAGFTVLAENVGIPLETVDKVLIGGSFGKYINVEKAVQIGLLPDMDWSRFEFLGNTSVKGAYLALLDWRKRERITEIAKRMTYIELSADNSFYDAFTSALFLPHTDMSKFPSVAEALSSKVEGRTSVDQGDF
ncbi:MAG: ASKHA domain-containing protein [Anaerolineales bacterium]|nr:ASKHA domain-containing protein [Anaerolineales bacterium]